MKGHDYSHGWYFITINTKNRVRHFGKVVDGEMELSSAGKIVRQCWKSIPEHFNRAFIGEFVIMPDHFHGILSIRTSGQCIDGSGYVAWKKGNLGVIINQFKRACTIEIRKFDPAFSWQSGYYDRIIFSKKELNSYSGYISCNPLNWKG